MRFRLPTCVPSGKCTLYTLVLTGLKVKGVTETFVGGRGVEFSEGRAWRSEPFQATA